MFNEMRFSDYHDVISWELKDAIKRYFEIWEDVLDREKPERERWANSVEQRRLSVIVLSALLTEAAINFYLCVKCDAKGFKEIQDKERTLFKKCTEVPKRFRKSYSIPADLSQDIRNLIDRRNDIVHSKPMISIDGDNRHKGNEPDVVLDEHEFVGRCATAPFRLVKELIGNEGDCSIEMYSVRISCGRAATAFEAGQRGLEVAAQYPRELIREIMEQGHSRDTAVDCAIVIGNNPETDKDGNIMVRAPVSVTLKPLKFFSAGNKSST